MNELYIILYTALTLLVDLFIAGFVYLEECGSIIAIAETVIGFVSLYVFFSHTEKKEIYFTIVSIGVVNIAVVAFSINPMAIMTIMYIKIAIVYGTFFINITNDCIEDYSANQYVETTVETTVADRYILDPHIRHSFMNSIASKKTSLILGTRNKTATMSLGDNGMFNLNLCENVNIKQHTVAYEDLIGFLNGYFLSFENLPEASNRAIVCRKRIYQSIKKSYNMFSLSAITDNTFFLTHGALIIKVTVSSNAKGRYTVECGGKSRKVYKLSVPGTIRKILRQSPFKFNPQEGQSSSSSRSKSNQKNIKYPYLHEIVLSNNKYNKNLSNNKYNKNL